MLASSGDSGERSDAHPVHEIESNSTAPMALLRISAIVDARFSLIVDGETVSSMTRRGGAQALGLNVAQSSTISLKPPPLGPVAEPVFG